ncbi:MAG: hypothetical protein ACSHWS_14645 [Sulfitobacter sp.]
MDTAGKWPLVTVQLIGITLSAILIVVTFVSREQVEQHVQNFAIAKVEAATNDALDASARELSEGGRAERLGALAKKFGVSAQKIDLDRQQIVPALLAYSLSDRCLENCGLAALAGFAINQTMIERAAKLRVGQGTLQEFIENRYETTIRGLITDLRLFGLVNLVALSLMLGLVLLRGYVTWRFTALSVAITGYTAWAAYGYVFNQNWALSILMQDWAAPGYQVAMIFVSALCFD